MAVQKNVIKGILAGTFALMLSGCGWPYGHGGWGWYNPGPARVQTVVTE